MELNPYLLFNGQCEAAFKFYEKCLGGKIIAMMPHEGTPAAGHVPAELAKKIIHARMVVGDKVLIGSDAPPDRFQTPKGFSVSVAVTTPRRGRPHISIVVGKRDGSNANSEDLLVSPFWHADGPIWYPVDD